QGVRMIEGIPPEGPLTEEQKQRLEEHHRMRVWNDLLLKVRPILADGYELGQVQRVLDAVSSIRSNLPKSPMDLVPLGRALHRNQKRRLARAYDRIPTELRAAFSPGFVASVVREREKAACVLWQFVMHNGDGEPPIRFPDKEQEFSVRDV